MQSRRSRSVSALRTRFRFCPLSSWQKTLKANLSWFGNGSGIACTYRKWATVSVPLRTGASVYREYLHARFPGSAGKRVRGAHGGGRVGRASPAQPGLVLDKIPGLPLALALAAHLVDGPPPDHVALVLPVHACGGCTQLERVAGTREDTVVGER